MNFFEEIAKLRAHRKMWAKVTREAGCTKPQCMHARVHIHTSGNVLVAQQPLNNTARITMQIMAAVLGGVQSIHSCSYDETIGIPDRAFPPDSIQVAADHHVGKRIAGRGRSPGRFLLCGEPDRPDGEEGLGDMDELEARVVT